MAVSESNLSVIEPLLEAGSDPRLQNRFAQLKNL
jgi:hypothetical protein